MRHVHPVSGVQAGKACLGVAVLNYFADHDIQFLQSHATAILDLHLKAAGNTQPGNSRRKKSVHDGFLDLVELPLQLGQDRLLLQAGIGASIPGIQGNKNSCCIGSVGRIDQRVTAQYDPVGNTVSPLEDILNLIQHLIGALLGGGVGKLNMHHDIALVLGGQKAGWQSGKLPACQACQAQGQQQHNRGPSGKHPGHIHITVFGFCKKFVEAPKEEIFLFRRKSQQKR